MTVRNARSGDPWDRCLRNGIAAHDAQEMTNDD
jgi:hypothetical protein